MPQILLQTQGMYGNDLCWAIVPVRSGFAARGANVCAQTRLNFSRQYQTRQVATMQTNARHTFRFGVVADVQYGDRETQYKDGPNGRVRRLAYRESLEKLQYAIREMNQVEDLCCIVSVGDLIEGSVNGSVPESAREARDILAAFSESCVPVHHVIGNHCRSIPLGTLKDLLELEQHHNGYYSLEVHRGWRFIILNGAEVCTAAVDATEADSKEMRAILLLQQQQQAQQKVAENDTAEPSIQNGNATKKMTTTALTPREEPIGYGGYVDGQVSEPVVPRYYGAISREQLAWFEESLGMAAAKGEHVVVFCHYPLAESATRATHVLVNGGGVVKAMEKHPGLVRCVFAGHDHLGGSAAHVDGAALHVTIQAMLESLPGEGGNAYAIVTARDDGSMDVKGVGSVPSYAIGPAGR